MSALLLHSFRRVRGLVLVMGTLLGLFQIVLVAVARSLEKNGQFKVLGNLFPPFLKALMGPAIASFLSFDGIVGLGYFEPAVLGAAVGLAVALGTRLALEVESGFIDLILARPVARHWVITRAIIVAVVSLLVMLAMMLGGTWAGLHLLAPEGVAWPTAATLTSLALNLGALSLSWSAIGLAIGSVARRRGVASGITGVAALVAFLVEYVARLWDPAKVLARLSPFAYYDPMALIMGAPFPTQHVIVLLAMSLAGFAAAYFLFLRRDISR